MFFKNLIYEKEVHPLNVKTSWNLDAKQSDDSGNFNHLHFQFLWRQGFPYIKPIYKQDFSLQMHWIFHIFTFPERSDKQKEQLKCYLVKSTTLGSAM